ncbi:hypothetical protein [Kineococcus glutinatus]|uniref:O-antigen ligase-like membrane protein n=1 Tax=Kineococcus glutinatus TaxID=1070872 RepID=A0ABP9HWX7_9ACTN
MTAPAQVAAPGRGSTLGWAAAGSAVSAVLVALLWLGPLVPLLVLAVAGAVLLAARAPQLLVALALGTVLLSTPLQALLGGAASSLDDAALLFCGLALPVRRLVTTGRLVWLPGGAWFAGFLAFGLLSGLQQEVPTSILAQGAFAALKGVLFAFAVAQVRWTVDHLRTAVRWGGVLVVVIAVSGLVNLALPGVWANLLGTTAETGPFGLPTLTGIFARPGAFSRLCGVLALAALAHHLVVRRSRIALGAFATCAALAVLTLQVKSILGLIATVALMLLPFLRGGRALRALAFLPLLALVALPPLLQLVTSDVDRYVVADSARSLLTQGGAVVATATFPFGAGFGRFGSSTAADNYSPWYYQLGFADRFGLGPAADSGQFLNDTQWPALYGEAGWLGAACFAAGLLAMAVYLLRGLRRETVPHLRWLRLAGAGWILLLVAESVAAPVFVSAPAYPFVFIAAGLVAASTSAGAGARGTGGLADDVNPARATPRR